MKIEFDPAKNAKNIRERGLPFTLAAEFDWTTATYRPAATAKPAFSRSAISGTAFMLWSSPNPRDGTGYQPAPRPQDGGKTL